MAPPRPKLHNVHAAGLHGGRNLGLKVGPVQKVGDHRYPHGLAPLLRLNLNNLGDIWRQSGELDKAETAYQQAEVIARKIGDKDATAYVLSGMGDLALDRGDLALSRKRYEEALALRTEAGEKQTAAESRVSLAKLAIEEGHASVAEASARQCKQEFQQELQKDDELAASLVIIDALLAQGKQSEVAKEIEADQPLGKQSQNRFLRLQFEVVSGRVILESGHPEAAGPVLRGVNREAQRYGFAGIGLATELALAEFATKTKNGAEAQREFRALQRSASSKSFGLIARKASQESSDLRKSSGTM